MKTSEFFQFFCSLQHPSKVAYFILQLLLSLQKLNSKFHSQQELNWFMFFEKAIIIISSVQKLQKKSFLNDLLFLLFYQHILAFAFQAHLCKVFEFCFVRFTWDLLLNTSTARKIRNCTSEFLYLGFFHQKPQQTCLYLANVCLHFGCTVMESHFLSFAYLVTFLFVSV